MVLSECDPLERSSNLARHRWPTAGLSHDLLVTGVTWSFGQLDRGCGRGVPCPPFDPARASYFTSSITFRDFHTPFLPGRLLSIMPTLLPPEQCPECGEQVPQPWVVLEPCLALTGCPPGDAFLRVGQRVVSAVTSALAPRLRQALADPTTRWIAPSDASSFRGLPRVRFVGLDPNGLVVRATAIVLAGGQLGLPGEQPIKPPPPQEPPASEQRVGVPFSGFGAVYDAADGRVWLFGGVDSAGERPSRAFWFDVELGRWEELQLDGEPIGEVLSATMAGALDAIYLVDRLAGARRLLELHLGTGVVRVLARARGASPFGSVAIRADSDGSVFVVATNERSGRHRVVRYRRDLSPVGSADGEGVPSGEPFVNVHGVSFPVRLRGGADAVIGYDRSELHGRSAPRIETLL